MSKTTIYDSLLGLVLHQQKRLLEASLNTIAMPREHMEVLSLARRMANDGIAVTPESVSLHPDGGERKALLVATLLERQPPNAPMGMLIDAITKENLRDGITEVCRKFHDRANEEDVDPYDSLMALQNEVNKLSNRRSASKMQPGSDMRGVTKRIEWLQANPGKLRGPTTGFRRLDERINGLQPGYYIFGARPSVGKSSILGNITEHMCDNGGRIALWLWESPADDYRERILSAKSRVNLRAFSDRPLTMPEISAISKAEREMKKWDWFINDDQDATMEDVEAQAMMLHMEKPLTMIGIDYLQQVLLAQRMKKFERVTEVSNRIAKLYKRLRVPIVVLAQLHRMEGRFVKELNRTMAPKPELDNLRDSGEIEQDADFVGFIDRDPRHEPEKAALIVAKNRNGPTGDDINLEFRKELTRFREIS